MTLTTIKPAGLSKPVDLADNEKIRLGTGTDLQIYHDGSNSYITESASNSTGDLLIQGNNIKLRNWDGGQTYLHGQSSGSVELYYDGTKKFETTSYGALVTGTISAGSGNFDVGDNGKFKAGNSSDLQIFHDGNNSKISHVGTGGLYIGADTLGLQKGDHSENYITMAANGAVELYHNNSKKFETTSSGVTVTGTITPTGNITLADSSAGGNNRLTFGGGADLQIWHDGSNSYIADEGTGNIKVLTSKLELLNAANNEYLAVATQDGSVELYENGTMVAETTAGGFNVEGVTYSNGLDMDDNHKILLGIGDDLQIYHDSTNSLILNSTGYLGIRSNTLYLQDYTNGHAYITCVQDGAVGLRYDNSQKFETTSTGAAVTGKLGIGTTSPSDELTLAGSDPVISIQEASVSSQVDIGTGTSTGYINIQKADGTRTIQLNGSGNCFFNGGNVGIGTNSPSSKLEIHDSNNIAIHLLKTASQDTIIKNTGQTEICAASGGGTGQRIAFKIGADTGSLADVAKFTDSGLCFGSDTAASNALDDYEEGNITWLLKKSGSNTGSTNGTNVKYTKIGRLVHVSGRVRTDSTGSNANDVMVVDGSLPFTPVTSGTSVVGHWRSQDRTDSTLTASIAWVGSSTTVYLYTPDAGNDYSADSNNVGASNQTNLVMTFSFTYQAS